VFDARDNLVEVRARLDTLDAARAAYDVYLKMPREPGQVVMIHQKARVLRRNDGPVWSPSVVVIELVIIEIRLAFATRLPAGVPARASRHCPAGFLVLVLRLLKSCVYVSRRIWFCKSYGLWPWVWPWVTFGFFVVAASASVELPRAKAKARAIEILVNIGVISL